MATTKVTIPKREKMLRVMARAAQAQSLVGGAFYQSKAERIQEQQDEDYYSNTTTLSPKSGCKSAGRCAMAELFFAAGYSNNKLQGMTGMPEGWNHDDYKVLWENYRIDAKDAHKIIGANDDVTGCSLEAFTKREGRVAKVISGLKDRVRVNPELYEVVGGNVGIALPTKKEKAALRRLGLLQVYKNLVDGNSVYGFDGQ